MQYNMIADNMLNNKKESVMIDKSEVLPMQAESELPQRASLKGIRSDLPGSG